MPQIVDLRQEIYSGMPVFHGLPDVEITVNASHEEWDGISTFGVETASPGVAHVSNKEVHPICGEFGFTHYENLVNLYQLTGRGRFRFFGLPLKIRGGIGSPVRAIAVFEE